MIEIDLAQIVLDIRKTKVLENVLSIAVTRMSYLRRLAECADSLAQQRS